MPSVVTYHFDPITTSVSALPDYEIRWSDSAVQDKAGAFSCPPLSFSHSPIFSIAFTLRPQVTQGTFIPLLVGNVFFKVYATAVGRAGAETGKVPRARASWPAAREAKEPCLGATSEAEALPPMKIQKLSPNATLDSWLGSSKRNSNAS